MPEALTERQKAVYGFLRKHLEQEGVPPTVREVAAHFGFRSPLSAQLHINALIRKGYVAKQDSKSRNLRIVGLEAYSGRKVPLLGRIRAGRPLLAVHEADDFITVDSTVFRSRDVFALRVIGESMIDAGILDRDIVIVKPEKEPNNGSIAAVLIDDEVTLKRFYRDKETVRLLPENKTMKQIVLPAKDVSILGRIIGLVRKI
jgi:repressor LexA